MKKNYAMPIKLESEPVQTKKNGEPKSAIFKLMY